MNSLILLAAGAAADTLALSKRPVCPSLAPWFVRGAVMSDRMLPGDPLSELPEDAWLRELLQVPEGTCVRALEARGLHPLQAQAPSPPWWSLRPCHIHLGMDHALLVDPEDLALTREEAAELAAAAAPAFSEAGLELGVAQPQAWFAIGPAMQLSAWPWNLASGRDISAYQPQGPQARAWRRLLTEVQMLWHEHPVNLARQASGQRSANALWLDGFVTALPTAQAQGLLLSTCASTRAIAQSAGWQAHAPDQDLDETLLAQAETVVIDLAFWRKPRRLGDDQAWLQAWEDAERWLQSGTAQGLLTAARRSGAEIRMAITGECRILQIAAQQRPVWRFWQHFDPMRVIIDPP